MRRSPPMNQHLASAIDLPNQIDFMPKITSREIRLASRPKGIPTAANFTPAQVELEPLPDQQVLVRNLLMSVDPYKTADNEGTDRPRLAGSSGRI